tara:strand:- start:1996 stop:2472 length:477 start_codon:yes stop_codon:yes gene_type:complete
MFFELILKVFKRLGWDLVFNILLIIVYLLSASFLEEDLFIGFGSTVVLLLIFSLIKEFHAETLRQIRRRVKLAFRVQNRTLKGYFFFFRRLFKKNLKCLKKLHVKMVLVKFYKFMFFLYRTYGNFKNKVIFLTLFIHNFLTSLVLKRSLAIIVKTSKI